MIDHIFEEKGELAMYRKLLLFLESIFGKPDKKKPTTSLNKINKLAIQSFIQLMLYNRDVFLDMIDGKDTKLKLWQKPNGEFFLQEYDKNKIAKWEME